MVSTQLLIEEDSGNTCHRYCEDKTDNEGENSNKIEKKEDDDKTDNFPKTTLGHMQAFFQSFDWSNFFIFDNEEPEETQPCSEVDSKRKENNQ